MYDVCRSREHVFRRLDYLSPSEKIQLNTRWTHFAVRFCQAKSHSTRRLCKEKFVGRYLTGLMFKALDIHLVNEFQSSRCRSDRP